MKPMSDFDHLSLPEAANLILLYAASIAAIARGAEPEADAARHIRGMTAKIDELVTLFPHVSEH